MQRPGFVFLVFALLVLPFFFPRAAAADDGQFIAVHVLSGPESGPASDLAKHPERDEAVYLFAALERSENGESAFYCPAARLRIAGKDLRARPWDEARFGPLQIEWYKVEWDPRRRKSYDNTRPRWHWDSIDYNETPFRQGGVRLLRITADNRPTLLKRRDNLGTMRYKVRVRGRDFDLFSPGREAVWRGGLSDRVHRISRKARTGHPLLDWVGAFYNLPYIWGSSGSSDEDHQSERFIGTDCADLIVAAARRAGYGNLGYGSTRTMKKYCQSLGRVAPDPRDGRYVTVPGQKAFRFGRDVRPGDLIFGGRHVGFLARDRGRRGWLDRADTVIHTFFAPPQEEEIGKMKLFAHGFEILRLRRDVKLSAEELKNARQEAEEIPEGPDRERTHRRSVFSR